MSLWLLCQYSPGLAGEINCTEIGEGKKGERNNHRRPQWGKGSRVKQSGSRCWQEATGPAQLWPPVGREGWTFLEAMLEHLRCKGMRAVAVGRKAEGCWLFGEGELLSTGRETAWLWIELWINETAVAGRSPCCLAHPWGRMRISRGGDACVFVAWVGRRYLEGELRWQPDSPNSLSYLTPSLRSSLQCPWYGARSHSQ